MPPSEHELRLRERLGRLRNMPLLGGAKLSGELDRLQRQLDPAGRVPGRVLHQVPGEAYQLVPAAPHGSCGDLAGVQLDGGPGPGPGRLLQHDVVEVDEVDLVLRAERGVLGPREEQQVPHQPLHPLGLGEDVPADARPVRLGRPGERDLDLRGVVGLLRPRPVVARAAHAAHDRTEHQPDGDKAEAETDRAEGRDEQVVAATGDGDRVDADEPLCHGEQRFPDRHARAARQPQRGHGAGGDRHRAARRQQRQRAPDGRAIDRRAEPPAVHDQVGEHHDRSDGLFDIEALHDVQGARQCEQADRERPRVTLAAAHAPAEQQQRDAGGGDDRGGGLGHRDGHDVAQQLEATAQRRRDR